MPWIHAHIEPRSGGINVATAAARGNMPFETKSLLSRLRVLLSQIKGLARLDQ